MEIGSTVKVIALFDPSFKIRPLKFKWSGRVIDVREVTYTWKSKEGERVIYNFSLTDGSALYQLSYDTKNLLWRLENIEA
ncbi:MAG: hypothetical protein N2745_11950 [Syntrophorhabdaceae bacterium]|nr:hypothetical protein [Syntrophorhabdaceae bacterium]